MNTGNVLFAVQNGTYVLKFVGDVRLEFGTRIDAFIDMLGRDPDMTGVLVDLTETVHVDSTSLGLLGKLSSLSSARLNKVPLLVCHERGMLRFLRTMGFSDLFEIVDQPPMPVVGATELPKVASGEELSRESVLNAHKLLMGLNEHNAREFKDLVHMLEQGGRD